MLTNAGYLQKIPTFREMPLTPKGDGWCKFAAAGRLSTKEHFPPTCTRSKQSIIEVNCRSGYNEHVSTR
jgi:hypothetical protein